MASNLPPGVTQRMIDPEAFELCECCGRHPDKCICPECPVCHEVGNPHCYQAPANHGLKHSWRQELGLAKVRLADLRGQVEDEAMHIEWIQEQIEREAREAHEAQSKS